MKILRQMTSVKLLSTLHFSGQNWHFQCQVMVQPISEVNRFFFYIQAPSQYFHWMFRFVIISMPGNTVSINEAANSRKHVHFVFYDVRRRAGTTTFLAIQGTAEIKSYSKNGNLLMNYSNELSELFNWAPLWTLKKGHILHTPTPTHGYPWSIPAQVGIPLPYTSCHCRCRQGEGHVVILTSNSGYHVVIMWQYFNRRMKWI